MTTTNTDQAFEKLKKELSKSRYSGDYTVELTYKDEQNLIFYFSPPFKKAFIIPSLVIFRILHNTLFILPCAVLDSSDKLNLLEKSIDILKNHYQIDSIVCAFDDLNLSNFNISLSDTKKYKKDLDNFVYRNKLKDFPGRENFIEVLDEEKLEKKLSAYKTYETFCRRFKKNFPAYDIEEIPIDNTRTFRHMVLSMETKKFILDFNSGDNSSEAYVILKTEDDKIEKTFSATNLRKEFKLFSEELSKKMRIKKLLNYNYLHFHKMKKTFKLGEVEYKNLLNVLEQEIDPETIEKNVSKFIFNKDEACQCFNFGKKTILRVFKMFNLFLVSSVDHGTVVLFKDEKSAKKYISVELSNEIKKLAL